MSKVRDNTTFDTPWNYSQNEPEPGTAEEQWSKIFGEDFPTSHGVLPRVGDENNSIATEMQLRETKSQSRLKEDNDDIPQWTKTIFGTDFRRYTEEWNQIKSKWQLKCGQISSNNNLTTTKESKFGFETNDDGTVPYNAYKNRTIASRENNRNSDSEWCSLDDDQIKKIKEFKRKRCIWFAVITVVICLVLAACISSTLLIHIIDAPKNKNVYVQTKISATATNQQYLEGMEDASSQEFKDFQVQFCSEAQTKLNQTSNCKVESLRNGSIIVIFSIYIKTEMTEVEVKGLIMDKLAVKENGKEHIKMGIFEIKLDSFLITESRKISEEILPTDSINHSVDEDTYNTKSYSSLEVSTKEESTLFPLQSANPTTFDSLTVSSSNEIEATLHAFNLQSTVMEQTNVESPVLATPSFSVEHVTWAEQQSRDKSPDGAITVQSSTTSEKQDSHYSSSSNSYIASTDESLVTQMSFSASSSFPDVTSQALSNLIRSTSMSYVLVTDSYDGNLFESLESPLITPSLVIDGSVSPSFSTSDIAVSSIEPSPSLAEMSTSISTPKPDVKAYGETVYQDEGNLTFSCNIDNYHNFTVITLEYDDVVIFNITKDDLGIGDSEWSLVQTKVEDTLTLVVQEKKPTCKDTNKTFSCSVNGDWGVVDESASSVVKVKPGTPEIYLPFKFIENEDTLSDIYCSVDIGVPAASVSWSVEFVDGQVENPYDFSAATRPTINSNQTCSNLLKSSIRRTFDMSWHNSSLCCTATQDQIKMSTCKKLYIIPVDFCIGKGNKLYDHPYDDCYVYVQCALNKTYINKCGEAYGLCFNEDAQSCSDAVVTTRDPNFIDDPYSCEGKPEGAYIPVKGICEDYARCVHGIGYLQTCSEGTYFNGSGPPDYKHPCDYKNENDSCESDTSN